MSTVFHAERVLPLPYHLREFYNQGQEGACVGFAVSWGMSILNNRMRYDARRLYREAQMIDEWDDTPPAEGTSVRAALDVLRNRGHWSVNRRNRISIDPALEWGIKENRWATLVDEIRTTVEGVNEHVPTPVFLGVNWYSNFDNPVIHRGEWWIGRTELGRIRGGHAVCIYKVSDYRQAVGIVNNWGKSYPLVWMPYDTLQRLLSEDGEAGLVTDR